MRDTLKIRELNDAFRKNLSTGHLYVTREFNVLPSKIKVEIIKAISQFNNFGDEIDPDNEHDFGFVSVDDIDIMFQIDCLQANSNQICSNPNTAEQSRRVLSIMLTKEC